MQSRYLYSIFFLLACSVCVMIFLSYRYIHISKKTLSAVEETADRVDTTKIPETTFTQDSWLGQIKKKTNQKSYFYAVSEIQLELN